MTDSARARTTPPPGDPPAGRRALWSVADPRDVEVLRDHTRGEVLLPDDPGFEAATRIWNGMIDRTPAVVVRPTGAADVVAAVAFARERGLPISVRGGGHNIAGSGLTDGGLTIDMSRLRGVLVDPETRTATCQGGCLLGDVDRETQMHGQAAPFGFISETGVAGLTLGGGFGYLTRRFGWTSDNLLAVDLVTADGRLLRADEERHADLFWALRGAGHNYGVATAFTFRLHEVGPTVYGGLIAWPGERTEDVLATFRELTATAPRELTIFLIMRRAPAAPFVPEKWHGRRICAMAVCHSGDPSRAEADLKALRALGDPVLDMLGPRPYTQLQSYLDATQPKGNHYHWKTEFTGELDDALLATMRDLAAECPIPGAQLPIAHIGGALNERDDGAVGNRDARFVLGAAGMWTPDDPHGDQHRRWIVGAWERFRRFTSGGNYVNFQTADDDEARLRAAYGDGFDRLTRIKSAYDPDNVFRSNRNIAPAG